MNKPTIIDHMHLDDYPLTIFSFPQVLHFTFLIVPLAPKPNVLSIILYL